MIVFKVIFCIIDFVASTLGWIILATLLICAVNGGSMQFTTNGETHCFGKCEITKSEVVK